MLRTKEIMSGQQKGGVLGEHIPTSRGILEKSSLRVSWYPSFAGSTISRKSAEISLTICVVYGDSPYESKTPWVSSGVDIDKFWSNNCLVHLKKGHQQWLSQ